MDPFASEEIQVGKRLGPTLGDELIGAGVTRKLSWKPDGRIVFSREVTKAERDAVLAVVEAHDHAAPQPKTDRELALEELDALTDPLARIVRRLLA